MYFNLLKYFDKRGLKKEMAYIEYIIDYKNKNNKKCKSTGLETILTSWLLKRKGIVSVNK